MSQSYLGTRAPRFQFRFRLTRVPFRSLFYIVRWMQISNTFCLQPSTIEPFFSRSLRRKGGISKRGRGRETLVDTFVKNKGTHEENKRQSRSWSCVAYQTPWYHIRVANVSLSKVPTYSLGPPLAPCPTRTPAPLDFQLPAPLTYTHL